MIRFSLSAALLCLLLLGRGAFSALAQEPAAKTVSLTADYGDGSEKRFAALPWREGLTVFDALQAAGKARAKLDVAHRGAGATLFVLALDGVKNEGASGKNWRYHVGGKLADRSCAVYELKPGDAVVWKFEAGQ
jgi:hypothetical protein